MAKKRNSSRARKSNWTMPLLVFGGMSLICLIVLVVVVIKNTQNRTGYDESQTFVQQGEKLYLAEEWVKRRDRPLDPWMGLERGMTQDQVRAIFGEPGMYDEGEDLIRWFYAELPHEERFRDYVAGLRVDFDATTKRVVAYIVPMLKEEKQKQDEADQSNSDQEKMAGEDDDSHSGS